ncbi:hypothetical protein [Pelagibius sp. Alg239-R121]|uniref:sialidase family protein n=1 Tax=Pelagibius sp. Alg239-R121 TaxID=2993448 RepID=UPI0024A79FE2|nr:hypothetical protein [Pelagibius sp. Alg239-R121]
MSLLTVETTKDRRGFFRDLLGEKESDPRRQPWQQIDGLAAGSGDVLWSGWASESEIFVVGDEGAIFHLAGGKWQRATALAPVPIHAVWGLSRDQLYAVGWMGAILAFDGGHWHAQRGCVIGENGKYAAVEDNTPLFDITGNPEGCLWVVGDNGTILTFRGSQWCREESGTQAHLRAVTWVDGRLFAAGADGTLLSSSGDGIWQILQCPVRSNFQAILALSPEHLLIAGGRYFVDSNGFRGDLLRWRNGSFEKLEAQEPLPRLRDLAAYRNGALAVGDRGRIYFIRGDRVDRLECDTTHDLMGVVPLSTGEALVVGDFGTAMTAAPDFYQALAAPSIAGDKARSDWERMESGSDRQLWGLWSRPGSRTLYAFGEEGILLRSDGEAWEALPPAGDIGLHALCDAGDGGLFAAGQLGEIHHFDGTTWRKHFDLHVDITILALWAAGPEDIFAVGDEGLVLHWDGKEWQRMISGTKSALYGLWGTDAEHLLAVGDFGLILRWNGERWDEFHAGTENFLFDVWGDALNRIFIVGLSGTIGQFDGRRWTLTPARARADLLAVSGGEQGVFAVGAGGTALSLGDRNWQSEPTGFDGGLRTVSATTALGVFAAGDGGTILRRCRDLS